MDETPSQYGPCPYDSSAYIRLELFREWQRQRVLAVQLGDLYLEIGRSRARLAKWLGQGNTRSAVRVLFWASHQYQRGGLTRRSRVAWRYAQAFHAAEGRRAAR
jgi:hypothetical protein